MAQSQHPKSHFLFLIHCAVRKYPYSCPPKKGLEFPGGGVWGLCKTNITLKKCMRLNWNFQRGGGGGGGEGIDIFWNYTCTHSVFFGLGECFCDVIRS